MDERKRRYREKGDIHKHALGQTNNLELLVVHPTQSLPLLFGCAVVVVVRAVCSGLLRPDLVVGLLVGLVV